MANLLTGINPQILKWARQKAGYTALDIANALDKDVSIIERWETGSSTPTYIQLEKLAYNYYKRPLALFFFPHPPDEKDAKNSFRTLPDFELDNLSADTLYAIRQAEAMQISLKELNDGKNNSERKIFNDVKAKSNASIPLITRNIRNYLGITLEEQITWKSNSEALSNWRNAIQDNGIFIFKRSFKQKDISGICLVDEQFPIIYLNNSSSKTRQIFTIFHEFAHLILSTNGITKTNLHYISKLHGKKKEIEIFCNSFAAEFLVPTQDFNIVIDSTSFDDNTIIKCAERYCVSREVILRKLLDKSLVDQKYYNEKVMQWTEEYVDSKKSKKGGNYYSTQIAYLGVNFLKIAFRKYYQGRIGIEQLADYLNVKVKNLPGIEQKLLSR